MTDKGIKKLLIRDIKAVRVDASLDPSTVRQVRDAIIGRINEFYNNL